MKSKVYIIIIVSVLSVISFRVDAQINEVFTGNWNFECLLAPAGFNSGLIEIQSDSVFTKYTGMNYRFPAVRVKMGNDTLIFNIEVNGGMVQCRLQAVDQNKLIGTAGTMEDEAPLILTKKEESEPDVLSLK
jgi:hypothetical protein